MEGCSEQIDLESMAEFDSSLMAWVVMVYSVTSLSGGSARGFGRKNDLDCPKI